MYIGDETAQTWRELEAQRIFNERIKETAPTNFKFFAAVDLGKAQDATCISVIEQIITTRTKEKTNTLRGLKVLPQGLPFTEQARIIYETFQRPMFKLWPLTLYVDASGLGEPVCDILQDLGLKFTKCVITSGSGITRSDGKLKISRNALFQKLFSYLAKDNFTVSNDMRYAEELKKQILALREKRGSQGGVYITSNEHDDLAVAAAIAVVALDQSERLQTGVTTLY